MQKFNEIKTRNELADYINAPRSKLSYVLYVKGIDNLYESFDIAKKGGGIRHIHAPKKELKQIQQSLVKAIYEHEHIRNQMRESTTNVSHAFKKGKSFITNAKIHRNKRFVVNVDLENFFDSFHFGRVRGYFMKNSNYQFPEEVATAIAQIVCYQGKLPQGAPTSPIITNLICNIFDMRLLRLAKKYKLDYTRYADDLSFSTNDKNFLNTKDQFLSALQKEIEKAGFVINSNKTRLQYKDSHQEVTGVVVNEKLSVSRKYYKKTRAMAHQLYRTGEYSIDGDIKGTMSQLEGRFSFINQLVRYNDQLEGKKQKFYDFGGRKESYRKFLVYKYLFANSMPLIMTEGKTDSRYIKAALKNMYKEYPRIVCQDAERGFNYRISFLKRTRRVETFLNISVDGADALGNIMEFYSEKGNPKCPKYISEFKELSGVSPSNPVILLYDNEFKEKNSPITKFSQRWLKEEQREELKNKGFLHIQDNLYILLVPLIDGFEKTDIEMLFDEEIQNLVLDGRTLDKSGKKDKRYYYNKDIFSRYIMDNYEKINFDRFRPILDGICEIITLYKKDID